MGSEEGNNEVVDNSGEESDEDNSDRGRKRKWKPPKGEVNAVFKDLYGNFGLQPTFKN